MNSALPDFRMQYVQMIEGIKHRVIEEVNRAVCQEIDTQANALFNLFMTKLNSHAGQTVNANGMNPGLQTMPTLFIQPTQMFNPPTSNIGCNRVLVMPNVERSSFVPQIITSQSGGFTHLIAPQPNQSNIIEPRINIQHSQSVNIDSCDIGDDTNLQDLMIVDGLQRSSEQNLKLNEQDVDLLSNDADFPCEPEPEKRPKITTEIERSDEIVASIGVQSEAIQKTTCDDTQVNDVDTSNITSTENPQDSRVDDEIAEKPREKRKMYKTVTLSCLFNSCFAKFYTKSQRKQHMSHSHGILSRRCLLPDCDRSFEQQHELNDHIQAAHSQVTKWKCGQCSRHLKDHSKAHEHYYLNHHEGSFQCTGQNCNYMADTRQLVINHYRCTHKFNALSEDNEIKRQSEATEEKERERSPFTFDDNSSHNESSKRTIPIARPFRCKWQGCQFDTKVRPYAINHIRTVHFNLPATKREQRELRIVDVRDPRDYLEVLSTQ